MHDQIYNIQGTQIKVQRDDQEEKQYRHSLVINLVGYFLERTEKSNKNYQSIQPTYEYQNLSSIIRDKGKIPKI